MRLINTYIEQDNPSSGHEEFGQGSTPGEVLASTPQSRSLEEDLILPCISDIEEQTRIPKATESEETLFGGSCSSSAHTTGIHAVCA